MTTTHPSKRAASPTHALLVAGDKTSAHAAMASLGGNGTDWEVAISPSNDELSHLAIANPPAWVVVETSEMRDRTAMLACVEPWLEGTPVVVVVGDDEDELLQHSLVEAGASVVIFAGANCQGDIAKTLRLATVREEIARKARANTITVSRGFPMAFYRLDAEGRFVFVNEATAQLFGFEGSEAMDGLCLADLCPQEGCFEAIKEILDHRGEIAGIEMELMHRSGRRIWVQLHAHTVLDRNGDTLYYEGAAVDVTARRRAFETVAEVQHRLESFFARSQIAHWIEDFSALMAWLDRLRAGGVQDLRTYLDEHPEEVLFGIDLIRVVDVNAAGLKMIGAEDKSQVLSRSLSADVQHTELEAYKDQMVAAWEGKSSVRTTGTGITLQGRPFDYVLTWVVTVDGDTDLGTVIVSIEDVTELNAAQRRLTHLSELKDRFIDSITHELRTPLTGVFGFAELLRQTCYEEARPETREYLDLLSSAAAGGAAILDNLLLAVELGDDGKGFIDPIHLHRDRVNVVTEAKAAVDSLAPEERSRIEIDGGTAIACGDATRVRQIIRNLLSNGIRYGTSEVRVRAYETMDDACIVVADDGDGIPEGSIEQAFARFESDSRDPGLTESLGIGLTVSRALARAMGGNLRYERSGTASLFTLTLPLQEVTT
ncbi:MAG: PAS domain-containing sensor histidine kinase [Acidimicrobiia bacterium]|nr:PAS domain-containing sensor histidine kinase [Acidimicrobiia bacterium]